MKNEMLKTIALAAIVGLVGCKKKYECSNGQSLNMLCYKGTDTIQYFTSGYTDPQIRIKLYYESLGYNCDTLPPYLNGGITYTGYMSQNDLDYLESEGFSCKVVIP